MIRDLMGFDFSLPMAPYGECRNQATRLYDVEMVLTRKPMVRLDGPAYLSANINAMKGVHSGN